MKITINGKEKRMEKIDVYQLKGEQFTVEIKHCEREFSGEQAWCLYVIIHKGHPLYEKACQNEEDYDTYLGDKIYDDWHGGCTYYNKQATFVKIGCDYQHLGDESIYMSRSTVLPDVILADAKRLYEYFANKDNEVEE